jgi:hypothetical protein
LYLSSPPSSVSVSPASTPSSHRNHPSATIVFLGHQTHRRELPCVVIPLCHHILCFIYCSSIYSRFLWPSPCFFLEYTGG